MSTISASTTTTTAYKVTADTTGTLVLQTGASPTTAVTIDGSQNVGIGTSSPTQKVTVIGDISIKTGNKLYLWDSTNAYAPNIKNASADNITFNTSSNVETMRIDSSGNLLVGQTARGLRNSNSFDFDISDASAYMNHVSGTSSGSTYIYFGYNGGAIGSISQNGTTGVLYNLTSDYRLKNDQQPLTGAKEFVMALQPKKWQWWDGSGEGVGFIAHEFMEVAKYSGHGEKDAVDENGNIVAQSIQPSSSEVMANLVAFIQELKAELDAAKADIATLKGAA